MAFAIYSIHLCHVGRDPDGQVVLADSLPWQIRRNRTERKLEAIKCTARKVDEAD